MWRLPYKLYYPIIIWVGHFCVRVCVSEMGEMRKRWESVRKSEKGWGKWRMTEYATNFIILTIFKYMFEWVYFKIN